MGKVIDDYEEFVRQSEKLIDDEGGDVMEENKFDINDAYEQVERADQKIEKLASEMLGDSFKRSHRDSKIIVMLICVLFLTNGMWAVAWFVGEEVTTVTEEYITDYGDIDMNTDGGGDLNFNNVGKGNVINGNSESKRDEDDVQENDNDQETRPEEEVEEEVE